ncbi:MAG: flagellar motor protein MotA, partial [Hyphomicrobium sp.]
MTALLLLSEEIVAKDMSVLGLFHHADIVVKCIIVGLLLASVVCWAMAFEKFIRVMMLNREIGVLEHSGKAASIPQARATSLVGAVGEAARTEW